MSYSTGIELSKRGGRGRNISKEKALQKNYVVHLTGYIYVPKILVGCRFKLVEVQE